MASGHHQKHAPEASQSPLQQVLASKQTSQSGIFPDKADARPMFHLEDASNPLAPISESQPHASHEEILISPHMTSDHRGEAAQGHLISHDIPAAQASERNAERGQALVIANGSIRAHHGNQAAGTTLLTFLCLCNSRALLQSNLSEANCEM